MSGQTRTEANIFETIRKDWAEAQGRVKQFQAGLRAVRQGLHVILYHGPLANDAM